MKSILSLIVCAFSVLALASTAQADATANGDFDFGLDGATGTVVFDAGINNAQVVHGNMTFSVTVELQQPDPGDPEGPAVTVPFDATVGLEFNCMVAVGNRAAMSGVVSSSNVPGLVGQQALLVVEDEVAGTQPALDAFVWGIYEKKKVNLAAKDYDFCPTGEPGYTPNHSPEDCGDSPCPSAPGCSFDGVFDNQEHGHPGASLTWVGSDFDLCPTIPAGQSDPDPDPTPTCVTDPGAFTTGIPTTVSVVIDDVPYSLVDCKSVPLSAYPLNFIPRGGGNKVQVNIGI